MSSSNRSVGIRRRAILALSLLAWWAGFHCCASAIRADEVTAQYFEQLRKRRLFSLAEEYCLERLSQETLSPDRRIEFTLELSRTFAEHARYTTGDEQTDLWERAVRVVEEFLERDPRHPKRLTLEVQRGLLPAGQGEFLRWQVDLFPDNAKLRQRAQTAVERAIPQLKQLDEILTDELRKTAARKAAAESLSAEEMRTLLYNVRFRLGASLLDQAKLFPDGSADRSATLIDAQTQLRPLAGGIPEEVMTRDSQILLAECSRLRGDLNQAGRMVTAVIQSNPPAEVLDRAMAERIRLWLALERPTDAAQALLEYRQQSGPLSGELRLLNLQVLIALWDVAAARGDHAVADDLLKQIEGRAERAEQEIGGYWGQRCRLLAEFARMTHEYGGELAPLVRKAYAAFGDGRIDEAISFFGEAAALAHRTGKGKLAVEFGYTHGSIQLEAKRYQGAADSFRSLAESYSESPRAAAAHLLWAYCLGKLYEEDTEGNEARRQAFADALNLHRERFPQDPTAVEATWMLAGLEESRQQITRALDLYQAIPADHLRGPEAQAATARCYEFILERLRNAQQPAGEWEREALERLGRMAAAFPREPEPLGFHQAETALRLARIHLHQQPADYERADRLLARILIVRPEAAAGDTSEKLEAADAVEWKSLLKTARQLRIVSLAARNRLRDAVALLEELSETSTAEVLLVLDGLTPLAKQADERTRHDIGNLQLQAAERLAQRRSAMTADERRRLDRCLAQAYLATNQPRKAVETYEALAAQSPRDRQLLRTVAELLIECGTRECLVKAKTHWRKLESLEKSGSPEWLDARYHVARCCLALEEFAECGKLLGVTRLLYPDLGGEPLRAKFAALELELKRRQPK